MTGRTLTIPSTTELLPIRSRLEWLSWRREVLTGGDIAAVCGLVPKRTPLAVWAEKSGRLPPEPANNIMRRGTWLEPGGVEALRETEPTWTLRRAKVFLRDAGRKIGGTPDLIAIDPARPGFGIVDIKVVARSIFKRTWLGTDEDDESTDVTPVVPIGFQLQVNTYAWLTGASWSAVCPLVLGEFSADFYVCPVPVHPGAWQRITAEAEIFWRLFAAGRRPPLRPVDDAETIKRMYAQPTEPEATVSFVGRNELPVLLAEREGLKEEVADKEKRIGEIDTTIKAEMAEASIGTLPGWLIKWRLESKRGYEVAPSSSRVLRIKRTKE